METSTGTASTILFGFAPTWVTDKERSVVFQQCLSELVFGGFVHVLGVVGDNGLGNRGSNGVNLCRNTTTLDTDTNVQVGKLFLSQNEDRLEDLETHHFRLDVLNGLSIDLDETPTLLGKCHSRGCLFPVGMDRGWIRKKVSQMRMISQWHVLPKSTGALVSATEASRSCLANRRVDLQKTSIPILHVVYID